ncbi:MAG: T9SS type A sorting domain-containing protein [Bacteroidetes bacterium]|nr:T9SS type A sorting domain-containing protein [Bacteroidota bacterium]
MKLLLSLFFLNAFLTIGFSQSGSKQDDGNGIKKANADTTIQVNWADWTSGTTGSSGVAAGHFTTDDGVVDISYSGEVYFIQQGTGTNYFDPGTPFLSSAVINAPPAAEMIGLSKATEKTLSFSQPVNNLFFAVVSLNSNGYKFNRDFEIVSTGCGYWGCGTLTKVVNEDGTFQINGSGEPHGVIRFTDSLSSITWTSLTNESWNGFTIGTYGVATVPVEMVSFTGSVSDNRVTLNWQTATETNNYGWEVQSAGTSTPLSDRSADWETVGFVAGKGTTTEPQSYTFSSPVTSPVSPAVYRLKQIDLDGTTAYSKILTLNSEPATFGLFQNYPNPFNPSTTISYSLPEKGFVKLTLFDVLGREITTLVNQEKEAGLDAVTLDASLLSAGTYYYSLTFNGKTETRSMLLVK